AAPETAFVVHGEPATSLQVRLDALAVAAQPAVERRLSYPREALRGRRIRQARRGLGPCLAPMRARKGIAMQVSLWMHEKPYCVTGNDRLDDVARAMAEGQFRHAPVVDGDGLLVGMVSDRDIREHKGHLPTTRVSAAMVEPAITIGPDDPIER